MEDLKAQYKNFIDTVATTLYSVSSPESGGVVASIGKMDDGGLLISFFPSFYPKVPVSALTLLFDVPESVGIACTPRELVIAGTYIGAEVRIRVSFDSEANVEMYEKAKKGDSGMYPTDLN